jgi:hypothetical protein
VAGGMLALLAQMQNKVTIEAKSKRNKSRLVYIAANAVRPVIEALNNREISISEAERIAHLAPETQLAELHRAPTPRKKPQDTKTIMFPGAEDTLAFKELQADMQATHQLELKAGITFNVFQRTFARGWRKLTRQFIKEHGYMQMWELAEQMVARISTEFPDQEQKELKAFMKEHGLE